MRNAMPLLKCIMLSQLLLFAVVHRAHAQNTRVTGTVKDDKGTLLSGVTVRVKNGNGVTATNGSGAYTLAVPDVNSTLLFTFIGYDTLEQPLNGRRQLDVSLVPSDRSLEQVIVVGYGSVRKRDLTGSVISVKTEDITKVASASPMEALQGKVSGVDVVRTSGGAGANVRVTVRGNRSIAAGNNPLYIVDGIQYANFEDINPGDIASMEFLKDAASTAIYGSRGANGVIIITTRKGASGKVRVNGSAYYGISSLAGYPKPMTGTQYADLKRQAYRTIGTWNSVADDNKVFTSAADLEAVQKGASYYWPDLLVDKGSQQNYSVGLAAGTDKTKVFLSFGFFREKGIYYNDYSNRYNVRLNVDQSLAKNFTVGLQSQLAYYDQNLRDDGILNVGNKIIPYFNPYNADGSLARFPGNGNQVNPLLSNEDGAFINQNNITRLLSVAYAEWKPVTGLSLRSNLGITTASTRNGRFENANTLSRALSTGSSASITNSSGVNVLWENILTYQKQFGEHSLTATGVTSYQSNKLDQSTASATGQLLANQLWYALQNNPANVKNSSSYVGQRLISGTARINYSYKGRYLLTATTRADAASVLSPQNRWAYFPSVAAGWRISDESFMSTQHVITELKLRASYGLAGNAAVNPYQTQSALMLIPFAFNDITTLAYGLHPTIGNTDLKWELTNSANIGIDFGLWKDRLTGSLEAYDSRTRDLLLYMQLPGSTGAQRTLANVGKTSNKGLEAQIRSVNIQSNLFQWSTQVTFQTNKERIEFLPGNTNDIANRWFIGHPVNSFYDYEKTGIWQTKDAAQAATYGYKPGEIRVADLLADGKITIADRRVLGSAVPKYTIGLNNDFKIGDFDINIFVFARRGQMFVSQYALKFEPNGIENGAVVDYWTPENPTNEYPRPNVNISRSSMPFATTLGYKDGSFVKIRNATIGYTLPAGLTKRMHLGRVRVYVSGRNFLTVSKVKNYDPEGEGSFDRPLTKLFLGGINIDL
ncbi:TonB-linked SusC/RagA family outer membrane protein [Filimonas zeae]|nr:TonB-dependent receptor [Filimonas zeae]MDR6340598.1 TonB-linked SusC/RagA family outer membrane protein [Filimonas zeae]